MGGMRMNIPNHVAIILDGNGRWAKSKGMPRNYGHVRGAQNLEVICEDAYNMGIRYLTVYLLFNGELETFTGRSRCADEAVPQIYKDVYQDGA